MRLLLASFVLATFLIPTPVFADGKCGPGKHWVRAHFRKAYVRSDGVSVSSSNVTAHCADNPSGFDFWSTKFKKGRPQGWPRTTENEAHWTDAEKERVLEELGRLPKALRLDFLSGLYRFGRSRDYPNPASNDSEALVIYDSAFGSTRSLGRILAHELAHVVYAHLPPEERVNYAYAAAWFGREGRWESRFGDFVESDGESGPKEDFANNVEYFLFNPKKLESVSPGAFNWIARHFGDTFRLGKGSSRD